MIGGTVSHFSQRQLRFVKWTIAALTSAVCATAPLQGAGTQNTPQTIILPKTMLPDGGLASILDALFLPSLGKEGTGPGWSIRFGGANMRTDGSAIILERGALLERGDITITADSLRYDNFRFTAEFHGHVEIKQSNRTLRGEDLTVIFGPDGQQRITGVYEVVEDGHRDGH